MSNEEEVKEDEKIFPPTYHTIILSEETYNFVGMAVSYVNCILREQEQQSQCGKVLINIQKLILLETLMDINKDEKSALRIIQEITTQLSPR